ncbi:MAG: hypothetical protein C4306_04935 [Thermoleophilia bacterium]
MGVETDGVEVAVLADDGVASPAEEDSAGGAAAASGPRGTGLAVAWVGGGLPGSPFCLAGRSARGST